MDGQRRTSLSGEIMKESGDQLPSSMSPQTGLPSHIQVQSGQWRNSSDILEVRKVMFQRIVDFLVRTNKISPEIQHMLPGIARKIDAFVFRMAQSKEEYMNMETMEHRFQICLQSFRRIAQQKKASGPVNSSSIGTVVPTPDIYQTTSRIGLTFTQEDSHVNALNAVPLPTTAFASTVSQAFHDNLSNAAGLIANDYQHSPANITLEYCGSNRLSFANGQGIVTQMISTPALSNNQSMPGDGDFFTGDQYLMHGDVESLNFSPYSFISDRKQNSRSIAVPDEINRGTNFLLPIRPLEIREPTLTESQACNVTRKRKIESAQMHDEYGSEMHLSWHNQVQLPHSHLTRVHDSRVLNNQQMVNSDLINKAQPGFQSGNQNSFDCRMDHVASHFQTFEQAQLTGSQVDFMEQRCLGNDNSKDDKMVDSSVGYCDARPSMLLDPLPQEHREAATPFNKHFQDDFHQRITNLDEAQQPLSSIEDNSIIRQDRTVAKDSVTRAFVNVMHEGQLKKQRWLLLLRHAKICSFPKGQCSISSCSKAKEIWQHLCHCRNKSCDYPNCRSIKYLASHHQQCRDSNCAVCIPVHRHIGRQLKARISDENVASLKNSLDGIRDPLSCLNIPSMSQIKRAHIMGNPEEQSVLVSRKKINHSSTDLVVKSDGFLENPSSIRQYDPEEVTSNLHEENALEMNAGGKETVHVKTGDYLLSRPPSNSIISDVEVKGMENTNDQKPAKNSSMKDEHFVLEKFEDAVSEDEKQHNAKKQKLEQKTATKPTDPVTPTKTEKLKIIGVSLIELFTPEQVKEHVNSLMQWFGQSKAKAEKNRASGRMLNESSCQLCGVERLIFQPTPIHCTKCGARIKRNSMYYKREFKDTRHIICVQCFNEATCDSVNIAGDSISKSDLKRTPNNNKAAEEGWVVCDVCHRWQHQICALFNDRKNGVQVEYTCPYCYLDAIKRGELKPLPKNAVMSAEDLPNTMLSDHIEQRLAKKLKQERHDRAKVAGKNFDEVAGVEGLVVRVVSSVDKRLEVKQLFLENFRVKNYPAEFAYKSKVILLFQKIEGVEVLLFAMYVQEFGSECPSPNQRRVYLSYLDSVKYFTPEIEAVNGEALRTVVYHEILIGYLEYCKARGFTSCYIWACPPLKGEDYIFYCHPEIQKTPKSDKLREWYLSMLRKATSENIVVEVTNLYDHFFTSAGECKAEVTATRLPYFEGDYWPGAAEDILTQLHQEEGEKQRNEVKLRKCSNRRSLKAADSFNPACNASKDTLLMQKLGECILPLKEDFIMVHLQKACSHCTNLMMFGKQWVCKNCKSFQLCDKCYDNEQRLEDKERHPANNREKHLLWPEEIKDVPADTKDSDEILYSEFLDTRQAFLSLCQGNYYQYDTLRRAKHSSMMVLYHLHNPAAPAFVSTCIICRLDFKTGQGWRCDVCPDFDVCNMCYQNEKFEHPHTLKSHPSLAEHDAQNQGASQQRLWQFQKMLDLLGHASLCRFTQCKYPNCVKVKSLFRHGIRCTIRASGGCGLCISMWRLLKLHARSCNKPECRVPRCKDLKEHMKRLLQQEDSRRREEVMEMMRQRAAEMKRG